MDEKLFYLFSRQQLLDLLSEYCGCVWDTTAEQTLFSLLEDLYAKNDCSIMDEDGFFLPKPPRKA